MRGRVILPGLQSGNEEPGPSDSCIREQDDPARSRERVGAGEGAAGGTGACARVFACACSARACVRVFTCACMFARVFVCSRVHVVRVRVLVCACGVRAHVLMCACAHVCVWRVCVWCVRAPVPRPAHSTATPPGPQRRVSPRQVGSTLALFL